MNGHFLLKQLALFVMLFCSACLLGAGEVKKSTMHSYTKASVYLISWEILSRSNMTSEYVRNNYSIKMKVNSVSEISRLLEVIQSNKMVPLAIDAVVDVRLVIDLTNNAGTKISYIASRNFLFTEDLKHSRRIDSVFRKKFRF